MHSTQHTARSSALLHHCDLALAYTQDYSLARCPATGIHMHKLPLRDSRMPPRMHRSRRAVQ